MNTCLGCQLRHVGCHSNCSKYLAYKQSIAKANAKRNEFREYYALSAAHIEGRLKHCQHTGERFY